MGGEVAAERAHALPAETREEAGVALLDVRVEAQRPGVDRRDAGRAHERRPDPPARGPCVAAHHEAAAAPPPEARVVALGVHANAAEHDAVRVDGDEHARLRATVVVVVVAAREEALLLDERPPAQRPVGGEALCVAVRANDEVGRRLGRSRSGPAEALDEVGDGHDAHPPTAPSAEQAPQAAQPAPWSAPRMPARRSARPTRSVTSATSSWSGAGTPSAYASPPCSGR